ncbi:MAG: SpoVR family protein, partial [Planctomycetales bacterium]|nr:SpoVR family protein [Planctomycetales bacterium]
GRDYEQCDDLVAKQRWNTDAGLGREKIFEVRQIHNDLTFIDEFLTLDFCRRNKLFSFGYNQDTGYYEIESRQFEQVKQQLLFSLTNMGRPIIKVRDGNYKNRGELYLEHHFNGPELKINYAQDTLRNLYKLWRRPVHIETVLNGKLTTMSFDGTEHQTSQANDEMDSD